MEAHLPGTNRRGPEVNLAATRLLEKMRWATIGPPYDWTARAYDTDAPRRPVNARWLERCVDLAKAAGAAGDFAGEFAGLVNYYRSGDQLAGHVDDAEVDMSKPIVSVSLGCPCVFLLGGRSRDVAPTAVLMRSGDAGRAHGTEPAVLSRRAQDIRRGRGMRGRTRGAVGVPRVAREPGRVAGGAGRGEVHRGRTRQRQRPRGRLGQALGRVFSRCRLRLLTADRRRLPS